MYLAIIVLDGIYISIVQLMIMHIGSNQFDHSLWYCIEALEVLNMLSSKDQSKDGGLPNS